VYSADVTLIINPLQGGLGYYAELIDETFDELGEQTKLITATGIESFDSESAIQRMRSLFDFIRTVRQSSSPNGSRPIIICWPLLGYNDVWLWPLLLPGRQVSLIYHDIVPLRHQWGMGSFAGWISRNLRPSRTRIFVHSEAAGDILTAKGWNDIEFLPHPIARPCTSLSQDEHFRGDHSGQRILTVAGKYKPGRALEVLSQLGARASDLPFRLQILGRGWPILEGWSQNEGFIPEEEFQRSIVNSTAVLVPYSQYNQSGVMLRALEAGVPIIGVEHPQIVGLLGENYPGIVQCLTEREVAAAFERVAELSRMEILQLVRVAADETRRSWVQAFSDS
jgi:glycosyltransferase involved in cell wall biosynthesis